MVKRIQCSPSKVLLTGDARVVHPLRYVADRQEAGREPKRHAHVHSTSKQRNG